MIRQVSFPPVMNQLLSGKKVSNDTDKTCCFVTAFRDLDRGKWTFFKRSTEDYINRFKLLLETTLPLVIFIDDHLEKTIIESVERIRKSDRLYTVVIPINAEFLDTHIHAYNHLEHEKDIMTHSKYIDLIAHRKHHPENSIAEYNIINHSKIDFVSFVIEELHSDCRFDKYGWIDFGFMEQHVLPFRDKLDTNCIDTHAVNFIVIQKPQPSDRDILHNLVHAPDRFAGAFFAGGPKALLKYRDLYHQTLDKFSKMNVADDDQAITLIVYGQNPELFRLEVGSWKSAFQVFSKAKTLSDITTIQT